MGSAFGSKPVPPCLKHDRLPIFGRSYRLATELPLAADFLKAVHSNGLFYKQSLRMINQVHRTYQRVYEPFLVD